jgi:hypothetical protein
MSPDTSIEVTFIDDATGQVIGVTQLSPEQLPATFAVATTFHLGPQEWQVQTAVPPTSAEFYETKKLTLHLRKVEYVNPQDILYTLPTLAGELPEMADAPLFPGFELSIHEDDWRQNEFLPRTALLLAAQEAEAIQRVWTEFGNLTSTGIQTFKHLHVRERLGAPGLTLDFARLQEVLGASHPGSLKFHDQPGFVRNGFALQTPTALYYGILEGSTVTHLCLAVVAEDALPGVQTVNQAFGLVFLIWYHAQVFAPEPGVA